MGTHPIFESDFDCLTDKRRFRICLILKPQLPQPQSPPPPDLSLLRPPSRTFSSRELSKMVFAVKTRSPFSKSGTTRPSASGLDSAKSTGKETPVRSLAAHALSLRLSKTAQPGTSSRLKSRPHKLIC